MTSRHGDRFSSKIPSGPKSDGSQVATADSQALSAQHAGSHALRHRVADEVFCMTVALVLPLSLRAGKLTRPLQPKLQRIFDPSWRPCQLRLTAKSIAKPLPSPYTCVLVRTPAFNYGHRRRRGDRRAATSRAQSLSPTISPGRRIRAGLLVVHILQHIPVFTTLVLGTLSLALSTLSLFVYLTTLVPFF